MSSVEPQDGQIYKLRDLYNNKVPVFTHYTSSGKPTYLMDFSESYEHVLNDYRYRRTHTNFISKDSLFKFKNGHFYPSHIVTTRNIDYEGIFHSYKTTSPIEGIELQDLRPLV